MSNTYYATFFDNEFSDAFETEEAGIQELEKMKDNKYLKDSKLLLKKIELNKIKAKYENEIGCIVSIEIDVDNEVFNEEFVVQMCDGEYLPQMGCWIIADDCDFCFNTDGGGIWGAVRDDIIRAAKSAYKSWKNAYIKGDDPEEEWEYLYDYGYELVSATSQSRLTVESSNKCRYRVFVDNSGFTQPNNYSALPKFEIEYFDSLDDVERSKDNELGIFSTEHR